MIKKLLTVCLVFAVISGIAGEMDAYHFTGRSKKSGNNPKNVASLGLLGLGFYNISLK